MICQLRNKKGQLKERDGRLHCWVCGKQVPESVTDKWIDLYRRGCGERKKDLPPQPSPPVTGQILAGQPVLEKLHSGKRSNDPRSKAERLEDSERWRLHQEQTAMALRVAAIESGVDSEAYDKFIQDNHPPPLGCYEKKCWWLKKFTKKFGENISSKFKTALFNSAPN